jgi:hypothetical protein
MSGVTAYAQCPRCARKHVNLAWAAWQELDHQADNLDYCAANLRMAGEHLAKIFPAVATQCRDVAIRIEDGDHDEVLADLNGLRMQLHGLSAPNIPLIIPYRLDESFQGRGDELRILLRSIERHVTGLSEVCIVADVLPEWLDTDAVRWIRQGNPYRNCKDANLHLKIFCAVSELGLSGHDRWCFSADDCAFLRPCDLRTLPIIYNGSPRARYAATPGNKWHRRMVNTFDYLASRGIQMSYSYDCHVPQVFEAATITEKMQGVDYTAGEGYCIYTLWRGLEGKTSGDIRQSSVVVRYGTAEDASSVPLTDGKLMCTYCDAPFGAGLRDRLYALFPTPSRYER